jgi:16S rRNA (cytidine1402-2'-O)-methyltransferase
MLHIVATPIGNLGDISRRAIEVLAGADIVAAEDTRRCRALLTHLGLSRTVLAYHDHSDEHRERELIAELQRGCSVALVADAGTPLISDPGFRLVRAAREAGIEVVCVPGPCAAIAALSIAGLPSDRFVFEGFLPAREAARKARLELLVDETRTLIFYESPRRVCGLLEDLRAVFGGGRHAVVARELTKLHETVLSGSIDALLERVLADAEPVGHRYGGMGRHTGNDGSRQRDHQRDKRRDDVACELVAEHQAFSGRMEFCDCSLRELMRNRMPRARIASATQANAT